MAISFDKEKTDHAANNFGALRLFFAILVIFSHSSELVDGNRSREILTYLFGTLSFGEVGVDGFFLISGYLITKSFQGSASSAHYLIKRALRIYPGYMVAYLVCILLIGPFVGGRLADVNGISLVRDMATLREPAITGVFPGIPYPVLNGSMWTIAYEFRCYILVMAAGLGGLLSRRLLVAVLAIACLMFSIWSPAFWFPEHVKIMTGDPDAMVRFAGIFACGGLFYLYRDRVKYDSWVALAALVGLSCLMCFKHTAEPAFATLGAYILFWFAFNVRSETLSAVGRRDDISYGLYLYAWPLQKLMIWSWPFISPWIVFPVVTVGAAALAFCSWRLIEKPALGLKSSFAR